MFLVQCEKVRTNHLPPLLVVTMPYACWFLWWVNILRTSRDVFIFNLELLFGRVVLREAYFEEPNRIEGH